MLERAAAAVKAGGVIAIGIVVLGGDKGGWRAVASGPTASAALLGTVDVMRDSLMTDIKRGCGGPPEWLCPVER